MRASEESSDLEGAGGPEGGTVVERTGLVVVHRGERIVPEAASRAVLRDETGGRDRAVELVFPVEIEVRGAAADADLDRLADLVLRRMTRGMLGS